MTRPFTRLEHARLSAGFPTQQALADAVPCSRSMVSRIESGMVPKWSPGARRLGAFLGISSAELALPAEYTPEAHAMLEELTV
jgi:ribosome-binding protein aMBF1 (putative translation factor)